jgi:hypothetical protein
LSPGKSEVEKLESADPWFALGVGGQVFTECLFAWALSLGGELSGEDSNLA